MKLNVKFQNEWFIIPINSKDQNVNWLIEVTIQRYLTHSFDKKRQIQTNSNFNALHNGQLINGENHFDKRMFDILIQNVIEIRKNSTNAILNKSDLIQEVLNDDDFLTLSEFYFLNSFIVFNFF